MYGVELRFIPYSCTNDSEKNGPSSFINIVREEVANQHFLIFLQCFLPFQKQFSILNIFFFLYEYTKIQQKECVQSKL